MNTERVAASKLSNHSVTTLDIIWRKRTVGAVILHMCHHMFPGYHGDQSHEFGQSNRG